MYGVWGFIQGIHKTDNLLDLYKTLRINQIFLGGKMLIFEQISKESDQERSDLLIISLRTISRIEDRALNVVRVTFLNKEQFLIHIDNRGKTPNDQIGAADILAKLVGNTRAAPPIIQCRRITRRSY